MRSAIRRDHDISKSAQVTGSSIVRLVAMNQAEIADASSGTA